MNPLNSKFVFKTGWVSPSNIALVKYWGKKAKQIPQNPSVSFTLKNSVTILTIEVFKSDSFSLDFKFEGVANSKFQEKISKFLHFQFDEFSWLRGHHLEISSHNTFPHSSGIASSASSMSALCLSLLSVDEHFKGQLYSKDDFFKKASYLSRLASGSAARSVYGGLVCWGESSAFPLGSNLYAINFNDTHNIFKDYCDSILIVNDSEKSVSSRAGHSLMENHPYGQIRFHQAAQNFKDCLHILKTGDIEKFISLVEEEALSLHALMMTSRPSYLLLKPESLKLIEMIRLYRLENHVPVCFTIDAGPNIHLLYPKKYSDQVKIWVEQIVSVEIPKLQWIHDEVGSGPLKLDCQ